MLTMPQVVNHTLPRHPSTVFLFQFVHIARLNDSIAAKKILTALLSEDWKRPPCRPQITWMKTVLNNLESYNLTLTEAVSMAQDHPLWKLLVASGASTVWCRPEMMMMMAHCLFAALTTQPQQVMKIIQ